MVRLSFERKLIRMHMHSCTASPVCNGCVPVTGTRERRSAPQHTHAPPTPSLTDGIACPRGQRSQQGHQWPAALLLQTARAEPLYEDERSTGHQHAACLLQQQQQQ
jgi:hypothetical protein